MKMGFSRMHFPVTTLGPGRRVGVWFQGCSIRCPGCISVDTWEPAESRVEIDPVIDTMLAWADVADGLTVSGGEPFDQPAALGQLLRAWRLRSGTSILVFTGRELDEISSELESLDGLIDGLITGRFRVDMRQTLALRGSDNQAIHALTPIGASFKTYDRERTGDDRRLDLSVLDNGELWFAGIPERGALRTIRRGLAAAGHSATTSDLRRQETK